MGRQGAAGGVVSRAQYYTLCGIGWLSCQVSSTHIAMAFLFCAMATACFVTALTDKGDKP